MYLFYIYVQGGKGLLACSQGPVYTGEPPRPAWLVPAILLARYSTSSKLGRCTIVHTVTESIGEGILLV